MSESTAPTASVVGEAQPPAKGRIVPRRLVPRRLVPRRLVPRRLLWPFILLTSCFGVVALYGVFVKRQLAPASS